MSDTGISPTVVVTYSVPPVPSVKLERLTPVTAVSVAYPASDPLTDGATPAYVPSLRLVLPMTLTDPSAFVTVVVYRYDNAKRGYTPSSCQFRPNRRLDAADFFIASIFLARWVVRPVEKAWNSQRQFIADASHELKTPLTVILSNGEMLTGGSGIEDAKAKTRLENILEETRCMKVLLDDMLTLARSDDAVLKVSFETIDFSILINNSVLIFEPILFDAGKRFEYSVKDEIFVTGDETKLRQLTEILLDNALKYTVPAGLVTVSLKLVNKYDVCLEVSNESETIPEEELSQIFERFCRLDKSRSSSGYGLGLAIAENIVREHSGKIGVKSEAGFTTFCITLPTAR